APSRSEQRLYYLVHLDGQVPEAWLLGGTGSGQRDDLLLRRSVGSNRMSNTLVAPEQRPFRNLGLMAQDGLDGADRVLDGARRSGPALLAASPGVVVVVAVALGHRGGADVEVDPPEQRHAGQTGEDQAATIGAGVVGIQPQRHDPLDTSECVADRGHRCLELDVGYDPAQVDVAVGVCGANGE